MRFPIWVVAVTIACLMSGSMSCSAHARGKDPTNRSPEPSRRPATVGQVISVDPFSNLMTLRTGSSTVTVDISSPILKGYNSVTEIKKGQFVAVRYTEHAIHVERATGTSASLETSVPTSPKKVKLPRRERTNGRGFEDVDNNKDGWISPIELSVLISDMTMEQFRTYDKNGDGRVDRVEYGQITLSK